MTAVAAAVADVRTLNPDNFPMPQPKLMMVNLPDLGETLAWEELLSTFRHTKKEPMVRALMQLLLLQMGLARMHEMAPRHEAREYFVGKAFGAEEVLVWLHHLAEGKGEKLPPEVKRFFGWEPPGRKPAKE